MGGTDGRAKRKGRGEKFNLGRPRCCLRTLPRGPRALPSTSIATPLVALSFLRGFAEGKKGRERERGKEGRKFDGKKKSE